MELSSFRQSFSSSSIIGFLRQRLSNHVIFTVFLLLLPTELSGANAPSNITITVVIVLGDSIVDQGNNNHLKMVAKCDFPLYGDDFMGGKPSGRFSSGKTPTDILVKEFGVKEFLPAYLDQNLQDKDLLTGVSFASGTTALDLKTSKLVGLYKLRAWRVAIHGVPPLGCGSSQTTLKGGILRKCEEKYNVASQLLNKKMSNAVSSFQNRQSDSKSRVFFVDLYSPLLEVIQNYTRYEADQRCCGTGKVEFNIFCNKLRKTCGDHSTYLFWGSSHPAERGYRVLVGKIFQTYRKPPEATQYVISSFCNFITQVVWGTKNQKGILYLNGFFGEKIGKS